MKTFSRILLLVAVTAPAILLADSAVDRKIEDTARGSYNYRVVLDNDVKVKADHGVVTLTGTVQDRDQKALAEDTVKDINGVTQVDNRIEVGGAPAEHSDAWIAWKARGLLLVHANVSATDTNITVTDGKVTLRGHAANTAQKELTEAYIKDIDGVKSVDNQIAVDEPGQNRRTLGDVVDDSSITAQVKYALLTHESTSATKTSVDTKDGVVTISGTAGSDAERDLVTKLTENVRGVKSVTNNMTVGPKS